MEEYSKAVSEMYSQFKQREAHPLEKYSKAVSEMYSQFKKEAHQMEKYIGRLAMCYGEKVEVVGYNTDMRMVAMLIVNASTGGGWSFLGPADVVFKKCESYYYVGINKLID